MLPLFLPGAVPAATVMSAPSHRVVLAMGTRLEVAMDGAAQEALAALERLEATASTWRPESAWSRLNGAKGEAVLLDSTSQELLRRALDWHRRTEGAFDPVLGALVRAWGLRTGGRVPTRSELAAARRASGAALLRLEGNDGRARLLHPDAAVEEGGFLKGAALDVLRREGRGAGFADFGGQLLVWGEPRRVEVSHPGRRHEARLALRLENASLACSGYSERGVHILDPRTGAPCPDWGMVAVVASTAFDADVLSTALFVMGPDQGLAWAEREGAAACFLTHDGAIRMSPAFRRLQPLILKESR